MVGEPGAAAVTVNGAHTDDVGQPGGVVYARIPFVTAGRHQDASLGMSILHRVHELLGIGVGREAHVDHVSPVVDGMVDRIDHAVQVTLAIRPQGLEGHHASIPVHARQARVVVGVGAGHAGDHGSMSAVVPGIGIAVVVIPASAAAAGQVRVAVIHARVYNRQGKARRAPLDVPSLVRPHSVGILQVPLLNVERIVRVSGCTAEDHIGLGRFYQGRCQELARGIQLVKSRPETQP